MAKFDMPATGSWEQRGGWVVRQLAKDLRLTLEQAAGIVGNFGGETEGFKLMQEVKPMVPGSRGGWGWAQWTGPRRREFEGFAARLNLPPASDEANYRFALSELQGSYRRVVEHLRATATVEDATRVVHVEYETPQDVLDSTFRSLPKRIDYARRALAGAQAKPAKPEKPPRRVEQAITAFNKAALRLQTQLDEHGFYKGQIDGDFGPASRAALLAYLKKYHPR